MLARSVLEEVAPSVPFWGETFPGGQGRLPLEADREGRPMQRTSGNGASRRGWGGKEGPEGGKSSLGPIARGANRKKGRGIETFNPRKT